MSHSNERELQLLRKHLLALVSEESPIAGRSINDLFLQADCDTGVLRLFDDEDQVPRLEQKGFWDRDCFARPFSIELVRPDFTVIEELLFLDEDLIKLDAPLLEGLNEELDKFLGDLLADLS